MNPAYVPRDYMDKAISATFEEWQESWSTLVVMATGTGKTEFYLQVAERFLKENPTRKVLAIAHREELITQPAKRWRRNIGQMPMIEMGQYRCDNIDPELWEEDSRDDRFVIATVQTLNSGRRCNRCTVDCTVCAATGKVLVDCLACSGEGRDEDDQDCDECDGSGKIKRKCKPCKGDGWVCVEEQCDLCFEHFCRRMQRLPDDFGLLIIDEAHHTVADSYTRLIRYFRNKNKSLLLLGTTATPDRTDEEAMGQVYQTVAYTYSLPDPITDGWLTPIQQQFVLVDELDLRNVRTTAGDLNDGDLEREMLAETVLHKVCTPLVEISCGLIAGTIDDLVKRHRIHDLPAMCSKRLPTLVHAASVAHAERIAEILNRYLPDSAVCIIGTTPRDVRRDGLERFAAGDYQYLISCGVFLEGTDLPNVSIVAMARPTKSRSLYAQMLGRGLRTLSGLIDGVASKEERLKLIAQSSKPFCLVIDFVGNSGRHKLVSALDILGDAYPDELVDRVLRKSVTDGQPVDVLRELKRLADDEEQKRKDKARRDAAKRMADEERRKKESADKRSGIVAGASYSLSDIDPFAVFDLAPAREPGYSKGKPPTQGQLDYLAKARVPVPDDATSWECHQLCDEVTRRRKEGLATFRQVKLLKSWNLANAEEWTFDRASNMISARLNPSECHDKLKQRIAKATSDGELTDVANLLREVKSHLSAEHFGTLVNIGRSRRLEVENPRGDNH